MTAARCPTPPPGHSSFSHPLIHSFILSLPQGIRRLSKEGWRPAGDNDGSAFMRPMTEEELDEQARNC